MGHTIPSKRMIMYSKLDQMLKFADTLRNPYRSRLTGLIKSVYENISGMIYVNSLDDEEMIVYAMLSKLCTTKDIQEKERVTRCISILISR